MVIVLVAALSFSATVLAKGKPSSGSVATFDNGTLTDPRTYVEDGITVTGSGKAIDIRDAENDGDQEVVLQGFGRSAGIDVDLGGTTFDLTSIDLEIAKGVKKGTAGISVETPEGNFITINTIGTTVLNWSGVTSVRITTTGFSTTTVDSIVINGGGKGNNGEKADKVSVCHVDEDGIVSLMSVNGNALNAHLNHGDFLPVESHGKLFCKRPLKPHSAHTMKEDSPLFQGGYLLFSNIPSFATSWFVLGQ